MTTLHICRAPKVDRWITVADDRPTRYCFGCRKHLPHEWDFGFYDEPTYYEPPDRLRCTGCGQDRTEFPGTGWDGPRPVPPVVIQRLREVMDSHD
jgi:hypothetical protein